MKKSLLAIAALSAVAGVARADVSMYGVLDMGIANLTSGQSQNPSMPAGVPTQIYTTNNGGKAVTTLAPNGMSQSVLGFKGSEDIDSGLKAGFILEAGINPTSGTITDGLSGLSQGNFKTSTGADTSRTGQLFNNRSTIYLSSKDWGTVSFGRQYTISLDDIIKYDPLNGSYAFSVVGFYGSYGGGGWTEDARLDNSVKYEAKFGGVRVGAMYQFGGVAGNNTANSAGQLGIGTDLGNLSMDAYATFKKDGLGSFPSTGSPTASNSMLGIISDNKAMGFGASYKLSQFKFMGGAEHIVYSPPTDPAGAMTIGNYQFSQYGAINGANPATSAYVQNKVVNILYGGGIWSVNSRFDLIASVYNVRNMDYTGCSNGIGDQGHCAGFLQSYALVADYHLSKRTDFYAGISTQNITGGVATFYNIGASANNPEATQNTTTMVGFRTRF